MEHLLDMCSCSEISKGIIHVIKKETFEKYKEKTDENVNKYYTLNLSKIENETIEDYKTIIKYFNTFEFTSIMNKN